jgi:hypothetical protein
VEAVVNKDKFWRRDLLKIAGGAVAGGSLAARASLAAPAPEPKASPLGEFNVLDYGAVGDGKKDNTSAFRNALADASEKGGTVRVPPGQFRFDGTFAIPSGATLEGSWRGPHYPDPHKGTMLLVYAGREQEQSDPFVTLSSNATIKGVSFYYPEQKAADIRPYPWTISIRGDRASVIDIAMANSYNALDCGTHNNAAHYLRNLNITALRRGVLVDRVYDIGRMENIHIHPSEWFSLGTLSHSDEEAFRQFLFANLEGFIIGKCDWSYMFDCFVIWAKVGFHFTPYQGDAERDRVQAPAGNILITQSGSDLSPLAVQIDAVQDHAGIAFENCQFMNSVEINETNTGPVKLTNCGFWGQCRSGSVILNKGKGEVFLTNCHFSAWEDRNNPYQWDPKHPFIDCESGSLLMTGCVFKDYGHTPNHHVRLGPNLTSAVLNGNLVHGGGKVRLENLSSGDVQLFGSIASG